MVSYYENVDVTQSLTIQSENGSAKCIVQAERGSDHIFVNNCKLCTKNVYCSYESINIWNSTPAIKFF